MRKAAALVLCSLLLPVLAVASEPPTVGIKHPAEGEHWNDCPNTLWVIPTSEQDVDRLVSRLVAENGTEAARHERVDPYLLWSVFHTRNEDGSLAFPHGNYTLEVTIEHDGQNATATRAIRYEHYEDVTPPNASSYVAGSSRGKEGWVAGPTRVALYGRDECRIGDLEARHNGEPVALSNGDGSSFLTTSSERSTARHFHVDEAGLHRVEVRAVDEAGNWGAWQPSEFKLDLVDPVSNFTVEGDGPYDGWYASPVELAISCTDVGSGCDAIRYSVDWLWRTYTKPLNFTSEGWHRVAFYSMDLAGRTDGTKALRFQIDLTPPTVDVTMPGDDHMKPEDWWILPFDGPFVVRCAQFHAEIPPGGMPLRKDAETGIEDVRWLVDGQEAALGRDVTLCFDEPGEHEVFTVVTDLAGRTGASEPLHVWSV